MSKNLEEAIAGSRRRFLTACAGTLAIAAGGLARSAFAKPAAASAERSLSFYNLHTGERLSATYWENGKYILESISEINFLLRDFRSGEVKPIDPRLLDLLHQVTRRLETTNPIHLISGYRSPSTNAKLHANDSGVAPHSLHMDGMAADIRIPGRDLRQLLKAAMATRGGGVGYYPRSDFVHVDVGRIRHWAGTT
ncbi:MAG TPA: YcbK family protein [Nitrospira sp.]|nr:YcbK family protein [Nitrospira sp.]